MHAIQFVTLRFVGPRDDTSQVFPSYYVSCLFLVEKVNPFKCTKSAIAKNS